MKPFNVRRWPASGEWMVFQRVGSRVFGPFDTQGEAIDFCYKNWPWWP